MGMKNKLDEEDNLEYRKKDEKRGKPDDKKRRKAQRALKKSFD